MAQYILKFESGDDAPKRRKIKRLNEDIDLDEFLKFANKNVSGWINSKDLPKNVNSKDVTKAINDLLEGYNRGDLSFDMNKSVDSTGRLSNLSENDPYGIALSFINEAMYKMNALPEEEVQSNKLKWDPNTGISLALSRRLFNGRDSYDDSFLQIDDDYNAETGKRGIAKRWNLVNQELDSILDDYDMTDEERSRALLSIEALRNAYTNDQAFTENEDLYLRNLGLDNKWFYTGEKYVPVDERTNSQKLDDELAAIKEEEANDQKREKIDAHKWKKELLGMTSDPSKIRDYSRVRDLRSIVDFGLDDPNADEFTLEKRQKTADYWNSLRHNRANIFADYAISDDLYNGNVRGDLFGSNSAKLRYSDGREVGYLNDDYNSLNDADKVLARLKAYALDWVDEMSEEERKLRTIKSSKNPKYKGWYVVDKEANNSGYVTIMDPKCNYMARVAVADINSTEGYDNYMDEYIKYHLGNHNIPKNKEGGILKALFGNSTLSFIDNAKEDYDKALSTIEANRQKAETDALKQRAEEKGRTVDEQKAAERKIGDSGLTGVDIARMSSIAMDLGSALASFTGVGSVAGGTLGMGSTLTTLGADIADDSVSFGDTMKNLAVGTGLSLIGLLPVVGGTGKFASGMAKAVKYIPKILTAGAAGMITLDSNVQNSLKKFKDISITNIANPTEWMKKNNITNEDLRNLALAFGAVTGLTRMGANSVKKRVYKARAKTGNTELEYFIKTEKDPKLKIDKATYDKFKEANTAEQANTILKAIEGQSENAVLTARKYRVAGKKTKFDKDSLITPKTNSQYRKLSNDEMTKFGRFVLGNPESELSDFGIIQRLMHGDYYSLPGLALFKNPETSAKAAVEEARAVTPISRKLIAEKSVVPTPFPPRQLNVGAPSIFENSPKDFKVFNLSNKVVDGKLPKNLENAVKLQSSNPTITGRKLKEIESYLKFVGKLNPETKLNGFLILNDGRMVMWKNGGSIKKMDKGGVADWYFDNQIGPNVNVGNGTGYYNLGGWNNTLDQSNADNYISSNGHYKANDLSEAYARNNAYITDSNLVSLDLNSYYKTLGGNLSALEFVDRYNADAAKIRGFFANARTYNTRGLNISDHNRLFRAMFGNRSQLNNNNLPYNIGYQENLDDVEGSNTWLRRMDTYENEFDLNNMDQNRIHTVNGFQVYKKANGDIALLPQTSNPTNSTQANPQSSLLDPLKTAEALKKKKNPSEVVADDVLDKKKNPNESINLWWQKHSPELLSLSRLYGTLLTNKYINNILRRSLSPTLKDTYSLFSPIVGRYDLMMAAKNSSADIYDRARNSATNDASLNAAMMLDANRQAQQIQNAARIADNEEIKRTDAENRKRFEDNIARWSALGNENRAELARNRRERALLDADYHQKQWSAIANKLQEQQMQNMQDLSDYRTHALNSYDKILAARLQNEIQIYKNAIRQDIASGKYKNIQDSPNYKAYLEANSRMYLDALNERNTILESLMNWRGSLPRYTNTDYNWLR